MDLLKVILENIKNKKITWIIILLAIIAYLRKHKYKQYAYFTDALKSTFNEIFNNIVVFIIVVMFASIIFLLLKYSDKLSKENYKERKLIRRVYESHKKEPFQVKIIENYDPLLLFGKKPYRTVIIYNNSNNELEYASGQVDFYNLRERVFSVPFKIRHLKENYSDCIINREIGLTNQSWDEFDLFISKAKFGDTQIINRRFYGTMLFTILPNITHKNIFEKLIPYDLTWFKREILHKIRSAIKWWFRIQNVYEREPTLKTTKNIAGNITRIIVTIPVIVAMFLIIINLIKRFFIMSYNIVTVWSGFFMNIYISFKK